MLQGKHFLSKRALVIEKEIKPKQDQNTAGWIKYLHVACRACGSKTLALKGCWSLALMALLVALGLVPFAVWSFFNNITCSWNLYPPQIFYFIFSFSHSFIYCSLRIPVSSILTLWYFVWPPVSSHEIWADSFMTPHVLHSFMPEKLVSYPAHHTRFYFDFKPSLGFLKWWLQ